MAENTIQITEESAIIPLKTLNMYKGLETTLAQLLAGEKFFKITTIERGWYSAQEVVKKTEICASFEWEARYAFEDKIKEARRDLQNEIDNRIKLSGEMKELREDRDRLEAMYLKYRRRWRLWC